MGRMVMRWWSQQAHGGALFLRRNHDSRLHVMSSFLELRGRYRMAEHVSASSLRSKLHQRGL